VDDGGTFGICKTFCVAFEDRRFVLSLDRRGLHLFVEAKKMHCRHKVCHLTGLSRGNFTYITRSWNAPESHEWKIILVQQWHIWRCQIFPSDCFPCKYQIRITGIWKLPF